MEKELLVAPPVNDRILETEDYKAYVLDKK